MADVHPDLAALRERIDAIDREILRLFVERARVVLEVGEVKKTIGKAVYDPDRERQVLEALMARAEDPVDGPTVRRVFERIIDESRTIEHKRGAK